MEQVIRFAGKSPRAAHDGNPAKFAEALWQSSTSRNRWIVEIKFHVTGNEQIQVAIVVVVSPGGSRGPSSQGDSSLFCHVRESSIMIIVIQAVLTVIRHVDIRPTVIVIIADSDSESPALVGYARLIRHIGECAVMIVMEEHGSRRRLFSFQCPDGGTAQEIDVQPPVIIVIQQGNPGPRGLQNGGFCWFARSMVKYIQAGLVSHIHKINWRTIYKSARGDWTHLGVLHWRAWRAGTHPASRIRVGLDRLLPARHSTKDHNGYCHEGNAKTP